MGESPATLCSLKGLKVCIASCDVLGPIRNGGIGTFSAALAKTLAANGAQVTLLFLAAEASEDWRPKYWQNHYRKFGVELAFCFTPRSPPLLASRDAQISYAAFEYLARHKFQVIHFPDWRGHAYYSLLDKGQGGVLRDSQFVITLHSPSRWLREGNGALPPDIEALEVDFLESECLRRADCVVSPSRYLSSWLGLAGHVEYLAHPFELPASLITGSPLPISELVFFGRLERRKGLLEFCDALDQLTSTLPKQLRIVFLGKIGAVQSQRSDAFITQRSTKWPWEVKLLGEYSCGAALRYLGQRGRFAVMPSLSENLPLAVEECLARGIPFLASATGGIPEMILEDDHRACLYQDTDLAAALASRVRSGARAGRPSSYLREGFGGWVALHARLAQKSRSGSTRRKRPFPSDLQPLVSVCIAHYNQGDLLYDSVSSIDAQTYPHIELLIVDDGSDDPRSLGMVRWLHDKFPNLRCRVIAQENGYLGQARNRAAALARGDFILFMDADNLAYPKEIETFMRAQACTGAEVVTSAVDRFEFATGCVPKQITSRWLPIGAATTVGIVQNCFGDANFMICRKTFEQLGGFTEDRGVCHEDWELLAKVALAGMQIEVVPTPQFAYRVSQQSMSQRTLPILNFRRGIRPYLALQADAFQGIFEVAAQQTTTLRHLQRELCYYRTLCELQRLHADACRKQLRGKLLDALLADLMRLARESEIPELLYAAFEMVKDLLKKGGYLGIVKDIGTYLALLEGKNPEEWALEISSIRLEVPETYSSLRSNLD